MMSFKTATVFCLFAAVACSNPAPSAEAEKTSASKAEPATESAKVTEKPAAPVVKATPNDASQFIARREGCDHFRGEEAYDEERGRFIRENVDTLCAGSDAELAALKAKYAGQAEVLAKLSVFENTIE